MKRIIAAVLTAAFILIAAVGGWAASAVPPKPVSSIYVQDYAGVMSVDTKRQINALGQNLQRRTKAQIAVVTLKSLEGEPIEEYSLRLFRQWGIGDKELNNGVLMLVSVGDRQSRIEVGYGLEGALPDGRTGQIQDEYMLPFFRQNAYDKGILNGYLALTKTVAAEYKIQLDGAAAPSRQKQAADVWTLSDLIAVAVIGVLLILDFMFFGGRLTLLLLSLLRSRGGGGGGGGFGGGSGGGGGSNRSW